jgi:hypothetical protein
MLTKRAVAIQYAVSSDRPQSAVARDLLVLSSSLANDWDLHSPVNSRERLFFSCDFPVPSGGERYRSTPQQVEGHDLKPKNRSSNFVY